MNDYMYLMSLKREAKDSVIKLNLHGLGLDSIPKEVFELKNLATLYLSNNNLKEIPEDISNLKNLKYLNLGNNNLSSIPEIINTLPLQTLILSHNEIREFPQALSELKKIKMLSLSNNPIQIMPETVEGFYKLENLFLEKLKIDRLPKSFVYLPCLKVIELDGNILFNVPLEIAKQGVHALRNYFNSLDESEESFKVYEAKLLIVGEGNVGKTCLVKSLISDDRNTTELTASTEGIDINTWYINSTKYKDFRINVWDFGGQEIYHATHQFFLTKRSLYILVWTARTDDNITSFEYWLNVIKLLSDNAPVLVVLNKIDERIKMIDEESISLKFKNIVSFHKVSALHGNGILELQEIIKNEIEKLPHIGDVLPKAWIDVRTRLESLGNNYISFTEYKNICSEYGLDAKQASYLSCYFHDLGIILHFQDNEILKDIVFLRPEWATNAVYKVTDTKSIQLKFGKFDFSMLSTIWSSYDEDKYKYLIELMKKFELCFKLNKNRYIIPELLSEKKPIYINEWDFENNLNFEYHYDFMPNGIITRLIVRVHDMIFDSNYWKNGLIIRSIEIFKDAKGKMVKEEITDALIICFPLERKIKICIFGYDKRSLLSTIRREINYIHKTLNNPNCREMIPCKCEICKKISDKSLFSYSDLMIYLENNENTVFCTKGKKRIEIRSLLEDGFGTLNIYRDSKIGSVIISDVGKVIFSDTYNS